VLGPLSQNGIDMNPTPAEIHTWESGCREFTGTAAAWQDVVKSELPAMNNLLAKNNLPQLRYNASAVATPANCTFAPPRTGGRR
jgi:hypothetical protein